MSAHRRSRTATRPAREARVRFRVRGPVRVRLARALRVRPAAPGGVRGPGTVLAAVLLCLAGLAGLTGCSGDDSPSSVTSRAASAAESAASRAASAGESAASRGASAAESAASRAASAAESLASRAPEAVASATADVGRKLDSVKGGADATSDVKAGTPAPDGDRSAVEVTARNTADSTKSFAVRVDFSDAGGNRLDAVLVTVSDVAVGTSGTATARSNRALSGDVRAKVVRAVRY